MEVSTYLMSERKPGISIIMYHSIAEGWGPISIAPDVFRRQLAAIKESGRPVVSLLDCAAWIRGEREIDAEALVLTFDDGYHDFASAAFPELQKYGFRSTVFIPAAKIGARADWEPDRRPLMSWDVVKDLAQAGVEFGAHGLSHTDLTAMPMAAARQEIAGARRMIEDRLGRAITTFAPPYGKSTAALREEIARLYQASVGTRMALANRGSDIYDLPRVEMWYFRSRRRWRQYLRHGPSGYFAVRKALRELRSLVPFQLSSPKVEA